jgi:hypothetical protein
VTSFSQSSPVMAILRHIARSPHAAFKR